MSMLCILIQARWGQVGFYSDFHLWSWSFVAESCPMTLHLLLLLYLKFWPADPQGIHFVCEGLCQSCHKSVRGCQKYWVFDQGEIPTDPPIANGNLMKWYCIRAVKPWITINIWIQPQSHKDCPGRSGAHNDLKYYFFLWLEIEEIQIEALQKIFKNPQQGLICLSRLKLNQGKTGELLLYPLNANITGGPIFFLLLT